MVVQRNQIIDFIRGFSILAVIIHHCYIHLPLTGFTTSIGWVKLLFMSGYYGVMIFFVVSGFLITNISMKRWNNLSDINLSQFYQMRFARIMPCLLGVLAISGLLQFLHINNFTLTNTTLHEAIFSALTFQINWLRANVGYLTANWDVLWSLSVEEVFYLFFPLLCVILRKKIFLVALIFALIVLGPYTRTIYINDEIWGDYAYLSCMDGIAIGCLAAMCARRIQSKRIINSFFIIGILLFSFIFFFRSLVFKMGISSIGLNVTILEIGIALILIASQQIKIHENISRFLGFQAFQWFGRNSYEIYLTHSFIVIIAAGVLYSSNQPTWLIAIEYLIIVLTSAWLGQMIATYYSEPFNRLLRNKFTARELAVNNNS